MLLATTTAAHKAAAAALRPWVSIRKVGSQVITANQGTV